ncbi:hypothetical protein Tco_0747469 [Tanacetum coccineum]|uniref:Uncharacterized protein n=1 Tax=Tanacetum coccineum TaxID=301880 RepID=A0ABQ4YVV4_9ASTR
MDRTRGFFFKPNPSCPSRENGKSINLIAVGIKRLHDDLGVNIAKEEMDLETAQTTTTAKLPLLKHGEYDMWRLRIEQYFQVQDYALWDVIENEHLMTFNQYKDAKTLFATIQTIFGGNEATKKTQKTLLKQMYENFSAPSTKSLDSIFNRLQKISTVATTTINHCRHHQARPPPSLQSTKSITKPSHHRHKPPAAPTTIATNH